MKNFANIIDNANEWTGKICSFAIIPLTFIVALDVTLRYIFNSPLPWGLDVAIQLMGFIVFMGLGYTLLHKGHICVDVFSSKLSAKGQAILDLITFPFFLLSIGCLLWVAVPVAITSTATKEVFPSYVMPPIYPFRIVIALGLFLLALQGIAKFIRDFSLATSAGEKK